MKRATTVLTTKGASAALATKRTTADLDEMGERTTLDKRDEYDPSDDRIGEHSRSTDGVYVTLQRVWPARLRLGKAGPFR